MEGKKLLTTRNIVILYVIMFGVGIAGHLITDLMQWIIPLTPLTLLLLGGVTLISSESYRDKKFLIWFAVTYLSTFIIEAAGVATGVIFGVYHYGDTLGLKLFEVPLIIGFNWVLVILGALLLAEKISGNVIVVSVLTGIFAVMFDFILEPVAVELNYWQWQGGIIPLQNYIAWFVIAADAAFVYKILKIRYISPSPAHYVIAQGVFFLILLSFMK